MKLEADFAETVQISVKEVSQVNTRPLSEKRAHGNPKPSSDISARSELNVELTAQKLKYEKLQQKFSAVKSDMKKAQDSIKRMAAETREKRLITK